MLPLNTRSRLQRKEWSMQEYLFKLTSNRQVKGLKDNPVTFKCELLKFLLFCRGVYGQLKWNISDNTDY